MASGPPRNWANTYESIVTSQPFRFLIGPEKKEFFVHVRLITQQSPTLAALVASSTTQVENRHAQLEDVDSETFSCFLQYAYTGQYSVPEPETVSTVKPPTNPHHSEKDTALHPLIPPPAYRFTNPNPDARPSPEPPITQDYEFWGSGLKRKSTTTPIPSTSITSTGSGIPITRKSIEPNIPTKQRLWHDFIRKTEPLPTFQWEARANKDASEDYTKIFLAHANLYIFADVYNVTTLQDLTAKKLRLTLSAYKLYPERVGDVVQLIKHSYRCTKSHESPRAPLRQLVLEYLICHIEEIALDPEFKQFLREEGSLGADVLEYLLPRLD